MRRRYHWRFLLVVSLGALVALGTPAKALNLQPETLHYTVDAPLFKDAARVTLTLTRLAPDQYEAVAAGGTQGLIALVSGSRRDRITTRMKPMEGKLRPQVYIEESWRRGKYLRKEYRFDYGVGRLELWQSRDDQEPALKWHTELKDPIFDPISAFYNFRLGLLGELKGGEVITFAGIPYPTSETVTVYVGPRENGLQKATVKIRNRVFDFTSGLVHCQFDDKLVPIEAWTRVLEFGKLQGHLVTNPTPQ